MNPPPFESGIYEMSKHLFDSNPYKKDKDLFDSLNNNIPSLGNYYPNIRGNKEQKPKSKTKLKEKEKNNGEKGIKYNAIARDQLQSEKYFTNLSGVCNKKGDEFLLPLINAK